MKPGESYRFKNDHAEAVVLVLKKPRFYEDPPVDTNWRRVEVLVLDVTYLSDNPTARLVFCAGAVIRPYVSYLVERIGSLGRRGKVSS